MIITDPFFYAVAIPAVLLTGISKSGFGGIALLAVPMMSLVMSPFEAAAITLPLLLMIDAFGVYSWRKTIDFTHLKVLIPGALIGVIIGGLTAHLIEGKQVKLIVGLIAVAFSLYQFMPKPNGARDISTPAKAQIGTGGLAGIAAGFTSYIAHAGSPPYHLYIIPKGLDKAAFAATGTFFFAVVNSMKLPAYIWAGQLDMAIFIQSLVLAPFVPMGVYLGLWLNKRLNPKLFFNIIFAFVFVIGCKLIVEGLGI